MTMWKSASAVTCVSILILSACGQPAPKPTQATSSPAPVVDNTPSIEELQAKVDDLETRLAAVESSSSEHEEKLTSQESDIDDLDAKTSDLESRFTNLQSDVDDIKLKLSMP